MSGVQQLALDLVICGGYGGILAVMMKSLEAKIPQDIPHRYSAEWVPFRDKDGKVVTLSVEQVRAVLHAVRVVDNVRATQPRPGHEPDRPLREDFPEKSRALGRLLLDGLPLFEDIPPYSWGASDYGLWDAENEAAGFTPGSNEAGANGEGD